jgi:tetratricopeptide (TPR) repeat protein
MCLGRALSATGDLPSASEVSQKGKEILEQLARTDPNNATLQEYLGEAYSMIAGIFLKQGEVEESFDYFTKAHAVFAKLSSADPTNSLARDNVALMEINLGDVLLRKGKIGPSMEQDRAAIAIFEKVEPKNRYEVAGQADAYASLGRALFSLAGQSGTRNKAPLLRQSQSWYEKSLATLRQEPGPKSLDPRSGDVTEQSVKQELSKCQESLANLTVR